MVTGRFYSAAMRRVSIITIACVLAGAACSTQPAGSDTPATALTAPVLAPATVSTITPAADPAVDRPFEVFFFSNDTATSVICTQSVPLARLVALPCSLSLSNGRVIFLIWSLSLPKGRLIV